MSRILTDSQVARFHEDGFLFPYDVYTPDEAAELYRKYAELERTLGEEPQNRFRIKEAVLSLLAGNISRGTPVGRRLLAFKALYYLRAAATIGASLRNWRARRQAARDASIEASVSEPS